MENQKKNVVIWKFILAILLCESVGIISGLIANANNNQWLETLNKPSWNPPAYLFGPVWTTLYLLMGISLGIIWNYNASDISKKKAYFLFAFQLFLNFWWSILFFHYHSPALALFDSIAMVIIILFTIFSFSNYSKKAAWLLVPYIFWVSFATILNFYIWYLNKS